MVDILSLATATQAQINSQRGFKALGAWSVISSNPSNLRLRSNGTTQYGLTTRTEINPPASMPFGVAATKSVFANWANIVGSGETCNTNPIRVRSAVNRPGVSAPAQSATDSLISQHFTSAGEAIIAGGDHAETDPTFFPNPISTRFWGITGVDCVLPPAPAAPSVTTGAGGSIPAATYGVAIRAVFPGGVRSACSPCQSIAVTGSQNILVTPAATIAGALGYETLITAAGGSQVGNVIDTGWGLTAFTQTQTLVAHSTDRTNAAYAESVMRADPTGNAYYPLHWGRVLGGTGAGAANTGDAISPTTGGAFDRVRMGLPVDANGADFSYGSSYGPVAVLGLSPDGRVYRSCAAMGDSICQARADFGFGGQGGGMIVRALMGQFGRHYNAAIVPTMGHVWLPQSGETMSIFSGYAGEKRSQIASLCTSIMSNYGTNDLGVNLVGSAVLANYIKTAAGRFTQQGRTFLQLDLLPVTNSTDGFTSITGQTFTTNTREGYRRAVNNWLSDATGAGTVSNETPFSAATAAYGPSANPYAGGDGATVIFIPAHPFVQGSEVVKVNGVTKVAGTDYNYTQGGIVIGSSTYASAITFVTAPANSATVTISYTKIPGYTVVVGSLSEYVPQTVAVEVNASGVPTLNGGFWPAALAPVQAAHSLTSLTTVSITDSSQAWTQDQWDGYCVRIVSDSVTPSAVNQVRCIMFNTATTITVGNAWTVTPSTSATYEIRDIYTEEGLHPATVAAMSLGQQIATVGVPQIV